MVHQYSFRNFRKRFDVIRVVGAGNDRLLDVVQIDVDNRRIFSIGICFEQQLGASNHFPCLYAPFNERASL